MKTIFKKTKAILSIAFIGIITTSCQKELVLIQNGSQVGNKTANFSIVKNISLTSKSDSLIVVDKWDQKKTVPQTSVWGILEKNGSVKRLYKGEYYKVNQASLIQIYSQQHKEENRAYHTHFYFSKGLNNELYSLDWKNLKNQFSQDKKFLSLIKAEFKWYKNYSAYDRFCKTYKIVEIYTICEKYNHDVRI